MAAVTSSPAVASGFGGDSSQGGGVGRQVISTPCKINTYLGVYAERDGRGYHRVDSLMVPVALYDTVEVTDAPELAVCHTPALEVAPQRTTVWKAAVLLAEELGMEPRVRVDVAARIPERAGLGGSSADAGAVLRALAERWHVDPLDARVVRVAQRVGADVPFFLDPEPGLFGGAGDERIRVFPRLSMPVALVMPPHAGASTAEAYAEFDRIGNSPVSYDAACDALCAGDAAAVAGHLHNNLASAACSLTPAIAGIVAWLATRPGVLGAQVTGSGACSFAICESDETALSIAEEARETCGWRAWATHTLG